MKRYEDKAKERLANKRSYGNYETHPEILAQKALADGHFASRVMDEFFTETYGEVLVDLFQKWLQTEPHETKTREFLYCTAMALGSVNEKLIRKETYGANVPTIKDQQNEEE